MNVLTLVHLLGRAPLRWRAVIGRGLGRLFGLLPTRDRQIARLQLELFLRDSIPRRTTAQVYAGLGQTLLESLNLKPFLAAPERYLSCPDLEFLRSLLAQQRPVVALSAHTGNWDLMAAYVVSLGAPLSVVGRPARRSGLQQILAELRHNYGVKTIWREEGKGSAAVTEELRHQRMIAALIDQDTRVSSVGCPFFGEDARTPTGLIALAKRNQALIVSAFCFRTALQRYLIRVEPLDESAAVEEIAGAFNQRLEAYLRRWPDQWVWFHKRWRGCKEGRVMSSSEYLAYLEGALKHAP